MALLIRLAIAVGYTVAAWLFSAFLVYAGYQYLGVGAGLLIHNLAIPACFVWAFHLYYRGPDPLPPAAAAALAVALIAAIDAALLRDYFMDARELFQRFWDWQLPAASMFASVFLTGRASVK